MVSISLLIIGCLNESTFYFYKPDAVIRLKVMKCCIIYTQC